MKKQIKFASFFTIILIYSNLILSQSTSVFDAKYFNKDNIAPPIKIGKGFHINDIYKQTRTCFTSESTNATNLTPQQTGGKITNIKLFFTKTNEEFNTYKSRGSSGQINFLNLFSLGGKKLEEFSNNVIKDEQRLIFSANVDFGIYLFENDPVLNSEAKVLVDQKKLQEFVKLYGTHYINGVRKESNITVIMTKIYDSEDIEDYTNKSINVGYNNPFKVNTSFELENKNSTNEFIKKNKFTITVEINGPSIDQSVIQNKITEILKGNIENKTDAITEIISSAIKNISDPNQSLITQYYYSPFTLYGLEGINWDEKKQNELIKINEAVIKVYQAKTEINEIVSPDGKIQIENEFKFLNASETDIKSITDKYEEIIPTLKTYNVKTEYYLSELEKLYTKCSDVFCIQNITCCNNQKIITEINNFNFENKINAELQKVIFKAEKVMEDLNRPECEKLQMGIVTIKNTSSNPYNLYKEGDFIETIPGNSSVSYYLINGSYNFKAVQKSGYLMYATVNKRIATISNVCQEVILKVGFED